MKILRDDCTCSPAATPWTPCTDPEREEFERHLQHCPSCDAEVRGLRETAARLAMARALRPARRMEQRVLAATYRTRQLPPLPVTARAARTAGGPSASRLAPRRMAAFAAAASVAAAVALGVTQVSTQHQLESARASDAAISRVVTAPDARVETTRTSGRKRHRGRLRRPAGSRRQRDRDGSALRAGIPGVGDGPVRRPFGGPDARASTCWPPRCPRRPDRDNRRARGRDVEAHHHARRRPARLALRLACPTLGR